MEDWMDVKVNKDNDLKTLGNLKKKNGVLTEATDTDEPIEYFAE